MKLLFSNSWLIWVSDDAESETRMRPTRFVMSTNAAAVLRRLRGSRSMPNYHLYFMSKGAPIGAQSIVAKDDAEATRLAYAMNEAEAVELWNDHRRLKVLGGGSSTDTAGRRPRERLSLFSAAGRQGDLPPVK